MVPAADPPFASQSGNGEDVVLWRALGQVRDGRCMVLGQPEQDGSPVAALVARGWREIRPPAATAGLHLLVLGPGVANPVPLAGPEADAPWVLLRRRDGQQTVAGALPGYDHCFYDGRSDFYLSTAHPGLAPALSYPACARDVYTTAAGRALAGRLDAAEAELAAWRGRALEGWAMAAVPTAHSPLRRQLSRARRVAGLRVAGPLRNRRARERAGRWV